MEKHEHSFKVDKTLCVGPTSRIIEMDFVCTGCGLQLFAKGDFSWIKVVKTPIEEIQQEIKRST